MYNIFIINYCNHCTQRVKWIKKTLLVNVYFFLLTREISLKVSFQELRTHFFFSVSFFNGFRRRRGKWTSGARPVKINMNISRCHFYFLLAIFLHVTYGFNGSDWNNLTSSEQDLTSKIPCRVSRLLFSLACLDFCWGWVPAGKNLSVILTETRFTHWRNIK